MADRPKVADHYKAQYGQFAADVHAQVRSAAFGEDVGQNSWLTVNELERFGDSLELGESIRLLDIACGSGGPALHLARRTGCTIVGVELHQEAVATGNRLAVEAGLEARASFLQADATSPLPFESGSFDAILCIDAINHFPRRERVIADWARLLAPGGRILFSDPLVVTGSLGSDEIAIRTSVGYGLFVPLGENERLLEAGGLRVISVEDTTAETARVARRRHDARAGQAEPLRRVEGEDTFEGRQRFFDVAATLAAEGRLSRYVYLARQD